MDLHALDMLMAERHSCRAFAPTQIAKPEIEQILATARRTPSWCNAQPWRVDLTSGAATDRFRTALTDEVQGAAPNPDLPFPSSYSGVYQDRRRACGWALYEAVGVTKGDRAGSAREMMRNFALFDAPHCAVISSPAELGAYGAMDCGGFVTAFCLAAQALGIATIPQAAVASYGPFLHRYFDIPQDHLILCAISFGYSDTQHPANGFRTERAEPDDFTRWHDD
ncbi:nitroreductase [Ruegeria jejuensis]|uniref:nitroreductase n=1 Tax=Ruegeria jejuensis TaxID=3233338 RepID=UPI00355BB903